MPTVLSPVPVVSMTQLAALHDPHDGPTTLYLNFDGSTAAAVAPFESTTGNRTRDINEILFRTSEMFAPFDVEVRRISGNGAQAVSGGDSTIFIGDKVSNSAFYEGAQGGSVVNSTRGVTPERDRPSMTTWLHAPNSNPADLAYVDPVSWTSSSANGWTIQNYQSWSNSTIARVVAHEAGHTFGLAHVLSSGTPEVMSYDASNSVFRNVSYPITLLNNNGTSTQNDPTAVMMWQWSPPGTGQILLSQIVLQNSYSYLQTALGARALDFANVADPTFVDPGYVQGTMPALSHNGGTSVGNVNRSGDYDVFTTSSGTTRWLRVQVETLGALDPVVFVMSGNGKDVIAFDDDSGAGFGSSLVFRAEAGQVYKIVVGSYSGISTGEYRVTVTRAAHVNPDLDPPDDFAIEQQGKVFALDPLGAAASQVAAIRSGSLGVLANPEPGESPVAPGGIVVSAPGAITFSGGTVSIRGTMRSDIANVRYVVAPGGAVSAAPTAWIRVSLDTPTVDFFRFYRTAAVRCIEFHALNGNDSFVNLTAIRSVVWGGAGNDSISSGFGNDIVRGGPGNDSIWGEAGFDYLHGDAGNDHIWGGTHDDHLIGDEGDDWLLGENGRDILEGRDGNDSLFGGNHRDIMVGGSGSDDLFGGPGDDLLVGGPIDFPVLGSALLSTWKEWTSAHDYEDRVANLRGNPHPNSDDRLNGDVYLQPGTTVLDDGDVDHLLGGADTDWFFTGILDTTDVMPGELMN